MVVNIKRPRAIYYPRATRSIEEIKGKLLYQLKLNGYEERIIFPHIHSLDLYDTYYSDIKKEYLVTSYTAEDEIFVFNPEYRTLIDFYAVGQFAGTNDYRFYYDQSAFSFTSTDAKVIKEDLLIGGAIINPKDVNKAWNDTMKTIMNCMNATIGKGWTLAPKLDYSLDVIYKGILLGYAKKEDNSITFHISLKDLYNTTL